MRDIFISYAREDKERAAILAEALKKNGWSVWWDRKIPPGKTFASVIEAEIEAAKCVIVLWSEDSIASDWVQNEASEGARKKILVPALIDDVKIPFEFRRIQAADLTDWQAQPDHPGFATLISAIAQTVGAPEAREQKEKPVRQSEADIAVERQPKEEKIVPESQRPADGRRKIIVAGLVLAVIIAVVGIWVSVFRSQKSDVEKLNGKIQVIVSKLDSLVQSAETIKSIDELKRMDQVIQKTYEPRWNKLQAQAQEQNINVDVWIKRVDSIERRWKEIVVAKRKELSAISQESKEKVLARKFESLVSELESQVKSGAKAKSFSELQGINKLIYGKYEPAWKELQDNANKQNINVDAWMKKIVLLESRWQDTYKAKRKEFSTIQIRPPSNINMQ